MIDPKCLVCGEPASNEIHFPNYQGCHRFDCCPFSALLARAERAEGAFAEERATCNQLEDLWNAAVARAERAEAWACAWKEKAGRERMSRIIYERALSEE